MMRTLSMTGLMFLLAFLAPASSETSLATAVRVEIPPVVDGALDEPFWQDSVPLSNFHVFRDAAGRRVNDTRVRLAYDDTWLYLGIECDNPLQHRILDPAITQDDGPVHQDESVEVFLTTQPEGLVYYHFLLSCFNVQAESRVVDGERERETWNLPWPSATKITEEGWTAEMAIPLYILLDHGALDGLRLNIARNRRMPFMDDSHVITHDDMEHSVWQSVSRSFHEPHVFGRLAPLTPGALQVPFLPVLEQVAFSPYFMRDGKAHYQVDAILGGANHRRGDVELVVTDRPLAGAEQVVRHRFVQEGAARQTRSIPVPVQTMAARNISIEVRDAGMDAPFRVVTVETPAALDVMAGYLDRNYYTDEDRATAVADIALPEDTLREMRVSVEVGDGVVARVPAQSITRIPFDIGGWPVGRHALTLALRQEDGTPFFAIEVELVKREPRPGREWKIDQIERVLLRNDEPFFPFGPVMAGITPADEEDFKTIAAAGCNTFFQWNLDLTAEEALDFFDLAERYGLYVKSQLETGWMPPRATGFVPPAGISAASAERLMAVPGGGSMAVRRPLMSTLAHYDQPTKTAIFREYVNRNLPMTEQFLETIRDQARLMAYSSFDEPFDSRHFDMTQSLDAIYRLTHGTDGYHPVMVLYSSHIPAGSEYVTCSDLLATDPYWSPGGPAGRNCPNFVSKIVYWNDRRAEEYRKSVWIVNVTGIGWAGTRKRVISGAEQQCQDFLALIHGAKGLFWFRYPMPAVSWENLKESIAKIKVVGPMTVQPSVRQAWTHLRATGTDSVYTDAPFHPEREQFPDVQGRIFRDPDDGSLVLLAANSRYYPVNATFTVTGLAEASVQRLFAADTLPVDHGAFAEALEPFAVRAYRLGRSLNEPVQVTLASRIPAPLPAPEPPALPNNAREGQKNVFPNPSFEQTTTPGLPDYYYGQMEHWTLDDSGVAKFGNHAVRLTKLGDEQPPYANIVWTCAPQHDQPTPYVWSFWAKGAQGGERLAARHAPSHPVWADGGSFTLTTEWQRYEISGLVIPARHTPSRGDFAILLPHRGDVWLDGMQLEKGHSATEFEE